MRLSVNVAIPLLSLATQRIKASTDLLQSKGNSWAMVGLSLAQGAAGVLANLANPDNTPPEVPCPKQ